MVTPNYSPDTNETGTFCERDEGFVCRSNESYGDFMSIVLSVKMT